MTTKELKDALDNKNVIVGTKRTIKYLKIEKVKKIILANNCPEDIKKDIEHYSNLSQVKIETFDGTGKQLGIFCGKPFPINTIAIKVK